ncbi:hypothetical protein GEMRC1_013033 [Eukaryota sp. GEM-RC1]
MSDFVVSTILSGSSSSVQCTGKFLPKLSEPQVVLQRGNDLVLYKLSESGLATLAHASLFRSIVALSFTNSQHFPSSLVFLTSHHEDTNSSIAVKIHANGLPNPSDSLGSPLEKPLLTIISFENLDVLITATHCTRLSCTPLLKTQQQSLSSHHVPIDEVTILSLHVLPSHPDHFLVLGDHVSPAGKKRFVSCYRAILDDTHSLISLSLGLFNRLEVPLGTTLAQPFTFSGRPVLIIAGTGFVQIKTMESTETFDLDCCDVVSAVKNNNNHFLIVDCTGDTFEILFEPHLIVRPVPIILPGTEIINENSIKLMAITSSLSLLKENVFLLTFPFSDTLLLSFPLQVIVTLNKIH